MLNFAGIANGAVHREAQSPSANKTGYLLVSRFIFL